MWTREKIEETLRLERFDYQRISLPHGLSTTGHDRTETARLIFADDLTGRSVLDVGSNLGFFSFEAENRGARNVLGIEVHPDTLRKARLLADIKGSRVTFQLNDIEEMPLKQPYDVVMCLNVLHHMHDPLAALNRLIDLAKERLILEVATFGSHDKKKVQLPAFMCNFLARFPIIFVTPTGTSGTRDIPRFYMSDKAIINLLTKHRSVFAKVEIKPSPHKGRFIVIGHKRRYGHLLVVSGPTSSGKKTLVKSFMANQLPELARRLGTPDVSVWGTTIKSHQLDESDEATRSHAILHYDIMRPYFRSTRVYARDEAMDLLGCADKVSFVTVVTPASTLVKQIQEAELSRKKDRRKERILELYRNSNSVHGIYEAWLEFARPRSSQHLLAAAEPGGGYRLIDAAKFSTLEI